jgi:hypothetical protein
MEAMEWKKVNGTQVMKVWEVEGKDVWPQISVLRVSNAKYLKFSKNPKGFMKFVNVHKVFSKPVIIAGPWVTLSSADPKNASPDWVLIMVHGKTSRMIVAALPQLEKKRASSRVR